MRLSYLTTSGQTFSKIERYMGNMGQKTKRVYFMDAESMQKTLKIFNFTTTYAILMKRTTDI